MRTIRFLGELNGGAVAASAASASPCKTTYIIRKSRMSTFDLDRADQADIIAATQAWLEKAVIGLNLCPFAKAVHVKQQIRYVVCESSDPEQLLAMLMDELQALADADPEQVDTTLLIHPYVLNDFLEYNEFLDVADAALEDLDLAGELQVASFHPDYQFADTAPDDVGNYTNRAPFPTLHLLREDSIERAVEAFPDAAEIFEKNIETLRKLGREGWERLDLARVK